MKIVISKYSYSLESQYWPYIMEMLQGETLEVETKYLFNDQFNTVPISINKFGKLWEEKILKNHNFSKDYEKEIYKKCKKSLCKLGLRIQEGQVEKVIGDIRIGKYKCHYCGYHGRSQEFFISKNSVAPSCPKCNQAKYIKSLESIHTFRYNKQSKKSFNGLDISERKEESFKSEVKDMINKATSTLKKDKLFRAIDL